MTNQRKVLCGLGGIGLSAFLVWMGQGGVLNAVDAIPPAFAWVTAAAFLIAAAAGWAWAADLWQRGNVAAAMLIAAGALTITAGCAFFDKVNLENGLAAKNAAPLAEAESSSAVAAAELARIRQKLETKNAERAEWTRKKEYEVSPDNPTPGKGKNYWDAKRALDVLETEISDLRAQETAATVTAAESAGALKKTAALQNGLTDVDPRAMFGAFFVLELWASLLLGAACGGGTRPAEPQQPARLITAEPVPALPSREDADLIPGLEYQKGDRYLFRKKLPNGTRPSKQLRATTHSDAVTQAHVIYQHWLRDTSTAEVQPTASRSLGAMAGLKLST